MNRSSLAVSAALAALCLALGAAVFALPAGAATVHFEKETRQAYEAQLHHGQVHALTFHAGPTIGHLHISLNNGGHMTVAYAVTEQGKLVAQARAANARVKIAAATSPKPVAAKHKLRYIAGGILIVVIIVVLVVLLIGRRRAVAAEGPAPSEESTAP
jgi:hypothetical protein